MPPIAAHDLTGQGGPARGGGAVTDELVVTRP